VNSNDGFITIASYPEPMEANLMRSKLLSEGIECVLLDEILISVQPFYSNAIGGIKLQVHQDEAEKAREVINESNNANLHVVYKSEAAIDETNLDHNRLYCPECKSEDVYFERFSTGELFLTIILLGIPALFIKGRYICYNCGNKWEKN